jgi:hypothetical protein
MPQVPARQAFVQPTATRDDLRRSCDGRAMRQDRAGSAARAKHPPHFGRALVEQLPDRVATGPAIRGSSR